MSLSFFQKLENRAFNEPKGHLCIGLDPVPFTESSRPTRHSQSLYSQCCEIIDQTKAYAIAYKPNFAYFLASGLDGVSILQKVCQHIPQDIPVLLDAKCGDIGSSSEMYSKAFYDLINPDGLTVSPYMGTDSIYPFLQYPEKATFILCKTSNPGSFCTQNIQVSKKDSKQSIPIYQHIVRTFKDYWKELRDSGHKVGEIGFVVGATAPNELSTVRNEWPDVWILAPGVGSQGANLSEALSAGLREDGHGLIIPISRGILAYEDKRKAAMDWYELINNTKTTMTHIFN